MPELTDHFNDAPKTIKQLVIETDPKSMYRLMRVLASVGTFAEVSDQCFALTPLAVTLQTDALNTLVTFN